MLAIALLVASAGVDPMDNGASLRYDKRVIPSCVIHLGSDYWNWRDGLGRSKSLSHDIDALYRQYASNTKGLDNASNGTPHDEVFCDRHILLSDELARIMNCFGGNATPMAIYHRMVAMLDEIYPQKNGVLSRKEFSDLLLSAIKEIESRFEESTTDGQDKD